MNELKKLQTKYIGVFQTVELIEIVGFFESNLPFNIFTIAVAQEQNREFEKDKATHHDISRGCCGSNTFVIGGHLRIRVI